jgi:hypothetical protein
MVSYHPTHERSRYLIVLRVYALQQMRATRTEPLSDPATCAWASNDALHYETT